MGEIVVLGLIHVSQVTCLVAGFEKSVEIAVLGLIRVSQETFQKIYQIIHSFKAFSMEI